MNTISNFQLPPPSNWEEFEDLCFNVWKRIWNDDYALKHGRKGQTQHGIDFYGNPNKDNEYVGVQCKCKENMYGSKLEISEIKKEIEEAKKFKPKLSKYIIATTSFRDAKIQEFCRNITLEHKKLEIFTVTVFFWKI